MSARYFNGVRVRRSVAAIVLAALAVVLAGCGGVEGVYEKTEKTGDDTVTVSLELKGDKTAIFAMKGDNAGDVLSSSGTYSVDGDKITINIDGDAQVFTLNGDKLSAKFMGEDLVLVKK